MRDLRCKAGPFEFSRRRRTTCNPDRLVRLFLNRGPILFIPGVHTAPKHARVYLRHQPIVVRPRFYPIRRTLQAPPPFHQQKSSLQRSASACQPPWIVVFSPGDEFLEGVPSRSLLPLAPRRPSPARTP